MLSDREKKLLAILVVLLFTVGLYKIGYKNFWKSFQEKREAVFQEKSKLKAFEETINKAQKLEEKLNETYLILKDYEEKLNLEIEKGTPWAQLGTLAKENNLIVNSVFSEPVEENKYYFRLPFKISLIGKYSDIFLFLDSLENLPNVWTVENFVIEPQEEEIFYKAEIDVSAYGKKTPEVNKNLKKWTDYVDYAYNSQSKTRTNKTAKEKETPDVSLHNNENNPSPIKPHVNSASKNNPPKDTSKDINLNSERKDEVQEKFIYPDDYAFPIERGGPNEKN